MAARPGVTHSAGCFGVLAIAIILLTLVFPPLLAVSFPPSTRLVGLRGEAVEYLFMSVVPLLVWLVPPIVRGLARTTHRAHQLFFGRRGFYVRFPRPRSVRFRSTLAWALGPLAIDLLVVAEIEYLVEGSSASLFARGLFAIPLMALAGIITSFLPGPWLVDALDLRLVNPGRGEVVREAALFEGLLGPLGAVALLASFITLMPTVGDSYEQGLVLLGLWAARMFPPVLATVSVYRLLVEPDVLPRLERWAEDEGIAVATSLGTMLGSLSPPRAPPPRPASEQETLPESHGSD